MMKQGEGPETWAGLAKGELRALGLAWLLPAPGSLAGQEWSPAGYGRKAAPQQPVFTCYTFITLPTSWSPVPNAFE